ncbi:MAG: Methionyl-tRNA formyltransferase [Lentisphaerae bacterium ADurb.BinA184]|nr:MAG: Methionyl-tRNA formyltransferase [Lentisphaerae bacterium ADurb.BinA184]
MNPTPPISDRPIRLYFLGSGDIGVATLETLTRAAAVRVIGVGTQPDRPSGRHQRLHATAIAVAAGRHGLPVDKPASVNAPEFIERLHGLGPDVILVVSFGQILKPPLLGAAPFGCLNIHASLLPRHRGAAPVHAAILAGDAETGVTLMQMDAGVDTGPVYRAAREPLTGRETTPDLEQRLGRLAARHAVEWVLGVCRDGWQASPQSAGASYARKVRKDDARVDWRLPAAVIERQIRAYLPWPRCWFMLAGDAGERRIQVVAATVVPDAGAPGGVLRADNDGWVVACGGQSLRLDRVIPEGRGEMPAADFLRGTRVGPGGGAVK